MIIDHSCMLRGDSISRMSEYLSLCKIDCLVRKVDNSTPSHRVDQPSKVGQVGTIAKPNSRSAPSIDIAIDYERRYGNRALTISIKNELIKSGLNVVSLTEAGTVTLQQGNRELESLPLYTMILYADNFAKQERKAWRVCLVGNRQDEWVNAFLDLSKRTRLQADYLINISESQIRYHKIPKLKGGR